MGEVLIETDALQVDALRRPVFFPVFERQLQRVLEDLAHQLDVVGGVVEKELPLVGMTLRRGIAAGFAEQFDQRLAFRSFAAAAGEPAGTIERTRQSGGNRLRHRIDDVFRLEFWKIGELVPDLAIENRVPRHPDGFTGLHPGVVGMDRGRQVSPGQREGKRHCWRFPHCHGQYEGGRTGHVQRCRDRYRRHPSI